jgi:hypothetical protein
LGAEKSIIIALEKKEMEEITKTQAAKDLGISQPGVSYLLRTGALTESSSRQICVDEKYRHEKIRIAARKGPEKEGKPKKSGRPKKPGFDPEGLSWWNDMSKQAQKLFVRAYEAAETCETAPQINCWKMIMAHLEPKRFGDAKDKQNFSPEDYAKALQKLGIQPDGFYSLLELLRLRAKEKGEIKREEIKKIILPAKKILARLELLCAPDAKGDSVSYEDVCRVIG